MKKVFKFVITLLSGAALGFTLCKRFFKAAPKDDANDKVEKFKGYYNLLNQWLTLKQEGKTLEQYFMDNQYKTVAIYGMGELGKRLYDDLSGSAAVQIKYALDKNAGEIYKDIDVKAIDEELEEVDAIIVTATFAFNEIASNLSESFRCPIVSLEDIVFEV